MRLKILIHHMLPLEIKGELHENQDIKTICYDSRKATDDALFVAITGYKQDGHKFIDSAISNGAKVVVCESIPENSQDDVLYFKVPDSRLALAELSKAFYENVCDHLMLIGITGTNGKTTTSYLIKSVLEANDIKTGLIATTGYEFDGQCFDATHTTPESLDLHKLFHQMYQSGCRAVVLEVSSHALFLNRTFGLNFKIGVFTNLSHDHLDFHKTMGHYAAAKKMLFDSLSEQSYAIVNADDDYAETMIKDCKAEVLKCGVEEATTPNANAGQYDVLARVFSFQVNGTSTLIVDKESSMMHNFKLIGRFNMLNLTLAYAVGMALGYGRIDIVRGLMKCTSVRGRMEQVWSKDHRCAIVDFSHTPDALENALTVLRKIIPSEGRIITVFGCGGNRDKEKRPMMGEIASKFSDVVIVTSDNPRFEDQEEILDNIEVGISKEKQTYRITDRELAIRKGVTLLGKGDVLLVAGKGHETYQESNGERVHFDDKEILEQIFEEQEGLL